MTQLSVNVNKLATLRNSRGKNNPDVLATTLKIIDFGAHGITLHPRPDERHIRYRDVYEIKNAISVELNVEGYPNPDFLKLIEEVRPAQATLVPDPPHVITSNAGWRLAENQEFLKTTVSRIKASGVRVSLFIDPATHTPETVSILKSIQSDRIELYTETYAQNYFGPHREEITNGYVKLAKEAFNEGIHINAGHDLDLHNLKFLKDRIPFLSEVSIGHALVCDALEYGLSETITKYLACLK